MEGTVTDNEAAREAKQMAGREPEAKDWPAATIRRLLATIAQRDAALTALSERVEELELNHGCCVDTGCKKAATLRDQREAALRVDDAMVEAMWEEEPAIYDLGYERTRYAIQKALRAALGAGENERVLPTVVTVEVAKLARLRAIEQRAKAILRDTDWSTLARNAADWILNGEENEK